ncbi:unnamed protein product [Vitrella brassicaformis CCMP3155]|uniref:Uncharacterized protein n=1 Tax=Vitrella brassicaformis (strain CCMP3155) TaxID=1169540 RepID=A0A0G4EJC5_VITBC|nr:unnamed protein product [Vitrella brassicaformis CCMP3155]|eukprot:CEL96602.1 unnamed protein product [Vitrella brassicaformis CCMP3155]
MQGTRRCTRSFSPRGIGGLCYAALLAKYGDDVTVCESHVYPGPSLWAGMSQPSINPLRQVLDAVGEEDSIEWCSYDGWSLYTPEGTWRYTVGPGNFEPTLRKYGGEQAVKEWRARKGSAVLRCGPSSTGGP